MAAASTSVGGKGDCGEAAAVAVAPGGLPAGECLSLLRVRLVTSKQEQSTSLRNVRVLLEFFFLVFKSYRYNVTTYLPSLSFVICSALRGIIDIECVFNLLL